MNHKTFVPLFCIIALAFTTCASSEKPVQGPAVTAEAKSYFSGDGGKGISLTILAPESRGLADTENYIPALVQGEFVSNFTSYSGISVLDRERLDAQYTEILSGYYDDDAEAGADLGHLIPTEFILGGSITKTASGYALQIQITKTSDKTTLHSYSGTCTFAELDNLTGVRRTSLDLLEKMGVQLTPRAQDELSGAAAAHEVQGQTALAQGLTAQRGGTEVQALTYYFQAANYDASLTEAASRVNILSANITSGNIGENIRNDIAWRDQWVARLAEAEQVYADNVKGPTPYYLVYDFNIKQGTVDYNKRTVDISGVTIDLVPVASWFNASASVVSVVNVVRQGLMATGRAAEWGLNWPRNSVGRNSPFGGRSESFTVVVELVNQDDKTIGSERVTVEGGWDMRWKDRDTALFGILPHIQGARSFGFRAVNADLITDRLTIRIASIDGVDAETAAKTKSINILREAEYAQLPEVAAGVDSRTIVRAMQEFEGIANGTITGYKGTAKNIVIPAYVFGIPVTAIGTEAFTEIASVNQYGAKNYKGKGITSVIIPNGITSIGEYSFTNNLLTGVTIPNSVTRIGEWAFVGNPLASVTILANSLRGFSDKAPLITELNGFPNSLDSFYKKNGNKAGTYTTTATYRRMPNSNDPYGLHSSSGLFTKWTYTP